MQNNSNLELTGCRFIKKQLSSLKRHLEGVKTAVDIEDVHQARVACRRLQSAFVFFSEYFDAEKLGFWVKHIKKPMKFLGKLRDLDVQIEFLKGVLADIHSEHKKEVPGIKRMMLRCRQQWDAEHEKIVKSIEKMQKKHVLTDIHLEAEGILFEWQNRQTELIPLAVIDRITRQLQCRVEDFRGRKLCLEQPGDHTGHHALRISVKQLRYEMEICDLVFRGEFKDSLKKIKNIQTILGDLHDCVVWESDICDFMELEKQRTIDYYGHDRPFTRLLPGLESLKQNRKNHHDKLLVEAYDAIVQLDQEDFWDTFLESLRTDKTNETESSGDPVEEEKNNTHIDPDNSSSAGCACKPNDYKTEN